MARRIIALILLCSISVSVIGLTACGSSQQSAVFTSASDAAFDVINLVLDSQSDQFAIAGDSVLLAKDAIKLIGTINGNQSPPSNYPDGYTQVSILYNKAGVISQDIYKLATGKAGIGVILEGGKTFESISSNNVSIDATQTTKLTIVPLQNATSKVTISATDGWQNTGIFLERGKQVTVKYVSGLWTTNKTGGQAQYSDAAGLPKAQLAGVICNCGEPLPGYPIQAMIGKIGTSPNFIPLRVSDSFAGVSYDNDFLYLRINQADSFLYNNDGKIVVAITTKNLDD